MTAAPPPPPPPQPVPTYLKAHRGVLILVLGILSLVLCILLGPFAWQMGNRDLAEMDSGVMDPAGRGMTQAGRIIGIIASVILVLQVIVLIFILLGGALSSV